MRVRFLGRVGILSFSLGALSCETATFQKNYEPPPQQRSCDGVNLIDGKIDGAQELRRLFDCLNNQGSLKDLEGLMLDFEQTINPATGQPYVNDLVFGLNTALAYKDLPEALRLLDRYKQAGLLEGALPTLSRLIETGIAEDLIPIASEAIAAGAASDMLPVVGEILRDPAFGPFVEHGARLIEHGQVDGWLGGVLMQASGALSATTASGDSSWEAVINAAKGAAQDGSAERLVATVDGLIDEGIAGQLVGAARELHTAHILQRFDTDLRPLLVQSRSGWSDFQGVVKIIHGTNAPMTCLALPVTDNLAVSILEALADRTESDVQSVVAILKSTLGLVDLLCSLPPEVEEHLDSLDALARSGALNTLLPMLRVFKANERTLAFVALFSELDASGVVPAVEPAAIAAIDSGLVDEIASLVPVMINADGSTTPAGREVAAMVDGILSPTVGSDYKTAPGALIGKLVAESNPKVAHAIGSAIVAVGHALERDPGAFEGLLETIVDLHVVDPKAHMATWLGDFIGAGAAATILEPLQASLETGNAEALLPWGKQMLEDGTAKALIELMTGAADLMQAPTEP